MSSTSPAGTDPADPHGSAPTPWPAHAPPAVGAGRNVSAADSRSPHPGGMNRAHARMPGVPARPGDRSSDDPSDRSPEGTRNRSCASRLLTRSGVKDQSLCKPHLRVLAGISLAQADKSALISAGGLERVLFSSG